MLNWSIEKHDELASTQDHLKQSFSQNPNMEEGVVIFAAKQKSGYGRHGKVWLSGEDNLFFSFLLRPNCSPKVIGQISLLVGLATAEALDQILEPQDTTTLKWPNDIMIKDKKCAGILIESVESSSNIINTLIVGIGVNANSTTIDTSASLRDSTKKKVMCADLLETILKKISDLYTLWKQEGFESIHSKYISKTYPTGSTISVHVQDKKSTGKLETIDTDGNLVLICDDTEEKKKITSGEIFLL